MAPVGVRTDPRHFADLFFTGGNVYTVDAHDAVVTCCAVRGDRIIGTGDEFGLLHLVGPETRVIHLEGRCLIPGLIDAHGDVGGPNPAATGPPAVNAPGLSVEEYLAGCREYLSYGVTSCHLAGCAEASGVRAVIDAHRSGGARLRTYLMLDLSLPGAPGRAAVKAGLVTGLGGPDLMVGPVRILPEAPAGAGGPGPEELRLLVSDAVEHGFQVTADCFDRRAVALMLEAVAGTAACGDVAARRHRIEHCTMLDRRLVDRIRQLGIVPVLSLCRLWASGQGSAGAHRPERGEWIYPLRSLLDAGVPVALGSGSSPPAADPYLGMYCAITRRTAAGVTVGSGQAVGFAEVLRACTYNCARASFEESVKGSIEPGKLADLAVVEPDLGRASPDEVRDARALLTVVGGEVCFER